MAIKTRTFGRVELSGKDAARFVQHMNEDRPNEFAFAAVKRARKMSQVVKKGESFTISTRSTLFTIDAVRTSLHPNFYGEN